LTEEANAAPAAAEAAPVVHAPNLDGGITAEEAFAAYQSKRNSPAESADTATAGTESAVEADAAPPEEATSEVAEVVEPEETLPLIERPRSWTKDVQVNDPFRFQEYQLYVWEQQAEQQDLREAESRKTQERQSKRAGYEAEQNKLLVELVPEMADPDKANDLRNRAIAMLTDDLGLKNDQLSRWMNDDTGHEILSNAGIQKLIADGLKFREIKAAPLKAIPKPIPHVQKPGAARAPGAAAADAIQATRNKLNGTGSVEDAFALYQAKKARAR
jgi:hypothetical protein